MKIFVAIVAFVLLTGCNGVQLSAEYSTLLDKSAALSAEAANRAEAGTLSEADKTAILRKQATTWALFQNARDGVGGEK
jgi:hypothetical protein